MDYGKSLPERVNHCPNCGTETQTNYRQVEIRTEQATVSFCDDCWDIFYHINTDRMPVTWTTENSIVTDIQLPAYFEEDVETGDRQWFPLDTDDFDWTEESVRELMDEFDAPPVSEQGVRGDVNTEPRCALCDASAAGDAQILGKDVCYDCFTDARNGKLKSYKEKLVSMYGEEDSREQQAEAAESVAESLQEEKESESERPDDFNKWSLEQWKNAYVDGEINLTALEIGVGHALEEQMDFSGPDSTQFERSMEVATELGSPATVK